MNLPIEKEYKILISKEAYEKICHSYDFTKARKQTNTYYDTLNFQLKKEEKAMRIRTIGNRYFFTLKIRKSKDSHIELEKEITSNRFESITDPEILNWLALYHIPSDCHPFLTFTTWRKTFDFPKAQLCADHTIYKNREDYELEYEYKSDHDGLFQFNQILKNVGLSYKKNCPSKIARAYID